MFDRAWFEERTPLVENLRQSVGNGSGLFIVEGLVKRFVNREKELFIELFGLLTSLKKSDQHIYLFFFGVLYYCWCLFFSREALFPM